jgi:hypothetical protein
VLACDVLLLYTIDAEDEALRAECAALVFAARTRMGATRHGGSAHIAITFREFADASDIVQVGCRVTGRSARRSALLVCRQRDFRLCGGGPRCHDGAASRTRLRERDALRALCLAPRPVPEIAAMTGLSSFFSVLAPVAEPPQVQRWRALIADGATLTLRLWCDEEDSFAYLDVSDGAAIHDRVDWELALDDGLVQLGVRAADWKIEAERFELRLFHGFDALPTASSLGFFRTVLVDELRRIASPNVAEVLAEIQRPAPSKDTIAYIYCRDEIRAVIARRASELATDLSYSQAEAEPVLDRALALYLNERFFAGKRRLLGFLA